MRLSADAKAYASGYRGATLRVEDIAEAFQAGFNHAKASQRRLETLAKGRLEAKKAADPDADLREKFPGMMPTIVESTPSEKPL
jgi:hypothetical protein